MKTIAASADIARSPHDVFDFLTDASRLPEWQPDVEKAEAEPPATRGVGMRGSEVRRVPGGPRTIRWEVSAYEPSRHYGVRGIDGPVRAHVTVDLTPVDDGASTHVDYTIGFEGHGIGKLIAPLARQGARKDVPASLALLKQRLERPVGSS